MLVLLLLLGCMSAVVNAVEVIRDPTQPLPYVSEEAIQSGASSNAMQASGIPHLQAIIIQSRKKFVILDGQRYREGDSVRQYRVDAIRKNEVILQDASQKISVLFYPNKVRHGKDTKR